MKLIKGTFAGLIILISCAFALNAQTGVTYDVSGSIINVDVKTGEPSYQAVELNSRNFIIPKIKGSLNFTEQIGAPEEYYIAKNIVVPGKGDYELEILNASYVDVQGNMIPNSIFGSEEIHDNSSDYRSYIEENAKIEYLGLQRGEHIARLMIKAAYQEPNSNTVKFVKQFKAKITLKNTAATNTSGLSNLSGMAPDVINPGHIGKWKIQSNNVNKSYNYKYDKLLGESVQQAVKIKIVEDGIYRLSAEKISSLGISIPNEAINSIKILGTGGKPIDESIVGSENNKAVEQEIIVRTESDGKLKDITFFGKAANGFEFDSNTSGISHYINHFSTSNYYILTWGGSDGKRAKSIAPPQGVVQNRPSTYIHRVFEEEELVNPYSVGGGRQWFGRSFFDSPFVNKLYNLEREGQILYKINLGHTAGENGLFEIFENNQKIDEFSIYPITAEYVHARTVFSEFSIPASKIEADNRSVLKIKYTNQYDPTGSTPYFDYYEIYLLVQISPKNFHQAFLCFLLQSPLLA